jgi:hypothetical protein
MRFHRAESIRLQGHAKDQQIATLRATWLVLGLEEYREDKLTLEFMIYAFGLTIIH